MIEPVNVPIILDLELSQVEYDLSVEEAEEYTAQIGSLITISEVYGGLPSGGNAGEILIKNSDEDYDAIWGTIKNGANIWWTSHSITQGDTAIYTAKRYVIGRTDMQPEIHDFLVGRDIEVTEGTPNTLYEIVDINQLVYNLKRIGNIGENDYNRLLNKPQIDGIEINKNSTSTSLGLATASALEEKYTKPSDGIPASDLAEGVIPEVHNIPSGGSVGQALIKNSSEDYDAIWSDIDNELPDVSSTDYGKVLTVSNDGIWNAQYPIFMVTITNSNNVFSADKTFSEINNAAEHNMIVVATYAGAYYQYCGIGGGVAARQFVYIFTRDNVQTIKLFSVNISNVWTQYQYQLGTYSKPDSGIPASDLADDVHLIPSGGTIGQVLRKISDNDWDINWSEVRDGVDGTKIWYTTFTISESSGNIKTVRLKMKGQTGTPAVGDYLFGPAVGAHSGEPTDLYIITVSDTVCTLEWICKVKGEDGSSDYTDIINKPQINGVVLSGNKTSTELGITPDIFYAVYGVTTSAEIYEAYQAGKMIFCIYDNGGEDDILPLVGVESNEDFAFCNVYSDSVSRAYCSQDEWQYSGLLIGTYSKPSSGIPKTDLASDVQSQLMPAGGTTGQLIMKKSASNYDVEWVSPASNAEQDNTLPITSAAVYTEIGNINALLATI